MALYHKKPLSDTIQTITTTSDNNYIVLTSQQYQYQLTNSPKLANGLFWTRKLGANPLLFLEKLEVNHDQTLRGHYHVRVDSHFSNPYKIFYLKRDGFSPNPANPDILELNVDVKGIRLPAPSAMPPADKESYPVTYVENDSALVTSGKVLITPITLVTDAVLLTAGAVFIITFSCVNSPSACTSLK